MPTYKTPSVEKSTHNRLPHRRHMTMKIILCLTLAPWLLPPFAGEANTYDAMTQSAKPYEVTGTLLELDLSKGKGLLRTDLGKRIYLEVRKPELFQNLSVGDRLTIQLNGDGQVDKVLGVEVPELSITGRPVPPQP
ncbi:MAG TPA: hypothetical protein VLD60_13230 [Nitrospira sp.]|nr:hypothetical protein [Nitrospira sp.]